MPAPLRLLLTVLAAGMLAAAAPSPEQLSRLKAIPAPPSMEAAERAAAGFIAYDLRYPETARFTFRPPMRALLNGRPGQPPIEGIYLCGTVRDRELLAPQTFMVMFGEQDPMQIEGGGIAVGDYAFHQRWCDQVYRDGIPVFTPEPPQTRPRSAP